MCNISKEDIEHLLLATTSSVVAVAMAFCVLSSESFAAQRIEVVESSEISGEHESKSNFDFQLESYNQPVYKAYTHQVISSEYLELERSLEVPKNVTLASSEFVEDTFFSSISEPLIPLAGSVEETTTNNEIEEQTAIHKEVLFKAEEDTVINRALSAGPEESVGESIEMTVTEPMNDCSDESKDDVVIHESVSGNNLQQSSKKDVPVKEKEQEVEDEELPPLEELTPDIVVEPVDKVELQKQLDEEKKVEPIEPVPGDKVAVVVDGVTTDVIEIATPTPGIIIDGVNATTGETVSADSIPEEPLLEEGATVDITYQGCVIDVGEQRDFLERLVMGEAGNQGFEGAALVAQSLRDNMLAKGTTDVKELKKMMAYSGSTSKEPNEDVKQAVAFIFDNGGFAVQHRINYFYNPDMVSSKFHESQQFVIEYGNHRFFSTW